MPELLEHFSLTGRNTLGFGVSTRLAMAIRNVSDVPEALAQAKLRSVPTLVLGGGSNIVLTGDFPGLTLLMEISGRACVSADDEMVVVEAAAGENWHAFVEWTLHQGWPGLENLALIPGTVGAAPVQNIGAYGLELADRFHSLDAWDCAQAAHVTLTAADCAFAYRDSLFKRSDGRYVITKVRFQLPRRWQANTGYADVGRELAACGVCTPDPLDVFNAVVAVRRRKLPDPAILGNVGSFFHNPVIDAARHADLKIRFPELVSHAQADGSFKLAAGWLIDQCGFKGLLDGHVGVHAQQALVLVHHGGGNGAELLRLAQRIRDSVSERYGVMLQAEPRVI